MLSCFEMTNASRLLRRLVKSVASDLMIELKRIEKNTSKSMIKSIRSFKESRLVTLNKLLTK
jgi:hypothetical protein